MGKITVEKDSLHLEKMGEPSKKSSKTPTRTSSVSTVNLSPIVSKLVDRVITRAQIDVAEDSDTGVKYGGDSDPSSSNMDGPTAYARDSDSSQMKVLVAVVPIPEESVMRMGNTTSYIIRRHTYPVESELDTTGAGGLIHRNPAGLELHNSSEIFAEMPSHTESEETTPSSSASPSDPRQFHSLIDEISNEVAESNTIFDLEDLNLCKWNE